MPRNQWIEKLVPARGEAEVMARVKGAYGAKGAGMRRYSKRNRFARLRKGAFTKKPQVWIPLFSGPQGSTTNRPSITSMFRPTNGSNNEVTPDQGWLFAITPELDQGSLASVMGIGGDIDPEQRYRVVGMNGSLFWTPYTALVDPDNSFTAWSGFISLWWYKVKASLDASGDAFAEGASYPWSNGWDDVSNTEGLHVLGHVPWMNTTAIVNGPSTLRFKDPRYRADLMRHSVTPFVIDMMPLMETTGGSSTSVTYVPRAQMPIRLPLPRKVICNVGRGEALGCAYQIITQSGTPVESSPTGIFAGLDLKVMVHELD